MTKRKPCDDKEQSKGFIEKAREIGADEKGSTSDNLMGRLAHMPPQPHAKPKAKSKTK